VLLHGDPGIALAIAAVVGVVVLVAWLFSPDRVLLRKLRAVSIVRIADVPDGATVRIVGRLRKRAKLLRAPLSGRKCAFFRAVVKEKAGKNSWREIVREVESVDFVVEDSTGRAIVETSSLEVAVVLDHHARSGAFEDAAEVLESFLRRHGLESTGVFGWNRALRYEEGVLEPGEEVAVLGRARWEDDPELGAVDAPRGAYREIARKRRLVIEAPDGEPVRASDDPSGLV
jgi:hypothetical protein